MNIKSEIILKVKENGKVIKKSIMSCLPRKLLLNKKTHFIYSCFKINLSDKFIIVKFIAFHYEKNTLSFGMGNWNILELTMNIFMERRVNKIKYNI